MECVLFKAEGYPHPGLIRPRIPCKGYERGVFYLAHTHVCRNDLFWCKIQNKNYNGYSSRLKERDKNKSKWQKRCKINVIPSPHDLLIEIIYQPNEMAN